MVRGAFWNLVFTHIRVYVNTNSTGVKTLRVLVGVMWIPGILFFLSPFSPQPKYVEIICNCTFNSPQTTMLKRLAYHLYYTWD